jgi:signal transduction histidine kinase
MSLPLLARRRMDVVAPGIAVASGLGVSFLDGRIVAYSGFLFLLGFACAFLVGFGEDRRHALLGLPFLLVAVGVIEANFPGRAFGDFAFLGIMFTVAWAAGFALKRRLVAVASVEEEARRAVEAERARIARELHDIVGHAVSVMTVQSGAVRRLLHEDQEREREALLVVEQTGRQALAEMRRLVGVLRNPQEAPALAPQPSLDHLDRLVAQVREAGLPVDLHIEGEPSHLPAGLDLTAYRLVQEALTNTLKHAQATHAEVVVRYGSGELEVTVVDDGVGALPSDPVGQGLLGMRERVSVYGGELRTGARRGGGFELRARLPVELA